MKGFKEIMIFLIQNLLMSKIDFKLLEKARIKNTQNFKENILF
jgi:hypothetical protein